jgi:hypothetical protein
MFPVTGRDKGLMNFLPGLAWNLNPPNLSSGVARIITASHCAQAIFSFFIFKVRYLIGSSFS